MTKSSSATDYTVCWIGNAGWLLRVGSINVLIDPDLDDNEERKSLAGIPEGCVTGADAVLITHEHGDHLNVPTISRLATESECRFIVPASCLHTVVKAGVAEHRIIIAHHDKTIELFSHDFTVTPKPAVHGAPFGAVHKHYHAADCGYLIRAMGITLFHPGDSVLLEEHFYLPNVDILMISPTEHNTNIDQSLILIEQLDPKFIFPQHRDTYVEDDSNYFWTHANDKELYEALDEKFKKRWYSLKQGEFFTIPTT